MAKAKFSLRMKGNSCYYESSKTVEVLLNSGSTDKMTTESFVRKHRLDYDTTDKQSYEIMDGTMVETLGWATWTTTIAGREMTLRLAVLKEMGNEQVVLGYKWMRERKAKLDLGEATITLGDKSAIRPMARSIHPDADNVLKRKTEKINNMTWEQFMPKGYHKYPGQSEWKSDTGILPQHWRLDYKFRIKPGYEYWYGYKPKRSTDEAILEKEFVEKHLKRNWIREIFDPIVKCPGISPDKKNGKKRYCPDYQKANDAHYLMPSYLKNMKAMITKAIRYDMCEWGAFDLADDFHTVRVASEDEKWTAFEALGRVFVWMVITFLLKKTREHFAAKVEYILGSIHMNATHRKEFGPIVDPAERLQYYMDDMLIMGRTAQDRNWYNEIFLRCCELNDLHLNSKMCEPEAQEVTFCGFLSSKRGIEMDPDKYALISKMKPPTTPAEVRKFAAWIEFSAEHYARLKEMLEPITKLARKAEPWNWGKDQQRVWNQLQQAMPTVLKPFRYGEEKKPEDRLPVHIATDASNTAWAVVYYQVNEKGERNIIRFDVGLFKTQLEQMGTATEREFRGVMNSLSEKHRHMTVGRQVFIHTDQRALAYYSEN